MQIDFKKLQFLLVALVVALVSSGCHTTGKHVRLYDGPPKETNTIALLKVERDIWKVILTVDKVDGRPLAQGKFMGNNTSEIELLPGRHVLEVSYRDDNDNRSTTDAKINFEAERGKAMSFLEHLLKEAFQKH